MKWLMKKAFTLLELIIVIIIVGILASLALPKFFKTVRCASTKEIIDLIPGIRRDMEECYARTGSYSCTVGNWGGSIYPNDGYLGYCVQARAEVGFEDEYYTAFIFEEDGDTVCGVSDVGNFRNGKTLGTLFRSNLLGSYKFYDSNVSGCFTDWNKDPNARALPTTDRLLVE